MSNVPSSPSSVEYPYFLGKDKNLSIWDDPSITGGISIPDPYKPLTHLSSVLNRLNNGFLDELDVILLKVIGDAISANEDQVKRYLESKTTRTQVTNKLRRMREFGFVERWQVESGQFPDNEKPPAPFTLGLAGFTLMKQLYNAQFFMYPQRWQKGGLPNVQRYVAANEVRCQLYEQSILRNWVWNGVINHNPQLRQPFAVAEIETPNNNINLVIERVQQGKHFLPYLAERLEKWEQVYNEFEFLPIKSVNENPTIIVIYVSNMDLAKHIAYELVVERFPMAIWFCVEEELMEKGVAESFFLADEEQKIKRIRLSFLTGKENKGE